MAPRSRFALLLLVVAGCGGEVTTVVDARAVDASGGDDATTSDAPSGDGAPGDGAAIDAAVTDALATDGAVAVIDAAAIDAAMAMIDAPSGVDAPPLSGCGGDVLNLTASQVCAISYTGFVTACSISGGVPSSNGHLEVRRPDGARGYVCAFNWTSTGGYYFGNRRQLLSTSSGCCSGSPGSPLSWPSSDGYGIPHAPTRVGRQETETDNGGDIRHNPFTIVVSNASSAAAYQQARASWAAWSGDGQAHPAPDGSGSYYFPNFLVVNYLVVPTTIGKPLILIAPEPSLDAAHTRPLGHPTLGACSEGGAPTAYIGGDIQGTTLTNGSGRFGFEDTVTRAHLDAAAALFNCYGIPINDVIFTPPS